MLEIYVVGVPTNGDLEVVGKSVERVPIHLKRPTGRHRLHHIPVISLRIFTDFHFSRELERPGNVPKDTARNFFAQRRSGELRMLMIE